MSAPTLQSFIAGQWLGEKAAQSLRSAVNGEVIYHTHEEQIDFAQSLDFARSKG